MYNRFYNEMLFDADLIEENKDFAHPSEINDHES